MQSKIWQIGCEPCMPTLRHPIHSHFIATRAAKCPASLICLHLLPPLSPPHRLLAAVCILVSAHLYIPAHRSHTALLNGFPRLFEDMSVAEIKERAIQQARRASRGASAISLIRSAKGQISLARACENAGDLKGAFSALTKAETLTQAFMDTADFKAESVPGKRGVLWKEYTEFQQVSCSPLLSSTCVFLIAPFSVRAVTSCSAQML